MISFVKTCPSYGRMHFKKSAILEGFLIVVENDKGLYSASRSLAIINLPNNFSQGLHMCPSLYYH